MTDKKIRYEFFASYDHTGLSRHLEQMAAKGWLIEKITFHGTWHYRRIEPQALHFAVTYYPHATIYDPAPTEAQQTFYDFCAHTGWTLAASWGEMQVFYNQQADPVPIETDPVLEVESIHRSAYPNYIYGRSMLLVIALLGLGFGAFALLENPLEGLANSSALFLLYEGAWLLLLSAGELGAYYRWHAQAVKAADRGEFLPTYSLRWLEALVLAGFVLGMVLFLRAGMVSEHLYMLPLLPTLLLLNAFSQFLKDRKTAPVRAKILGFLLLVALSLGGTALTFLVSPLEPSKAVLDGWLLAPPLTMADLGVEGNVPAPLDQGTESPFWGYYYREEQSYGQWNEDMERGLDAGLSYTVVLPKHPGLYDRYRSWMLRDWNELPYKTNEAIDPTPWGAEAAYRLRQQNWNNQYYLLCYEHCLVELAFTWTPDPEQMSVVAEVFGGVET